MWDKILDLSIYYSFDASGYLRHQKHFKKISNEYIKHRTVLITGGTSGIGKALALSLAQREAHVFVTGRDPKKFYESELPNSAVSFLNMDLCNFENIKNSIKDLPIFDYVVCNAGSMPSELQIIEERFDSLFASQVIGHLVLIRALIEQKKASHECAFHFNSSGGMLLKKLDMSDLTWKKKSYDKVSAYANAKRAQVLLNEYLSMRFSEYVFTASHPGWVATNALFESMPKFYKKLSHRLRTPEQGADTLLWLVSRGTLLHSGKFWFDRKKTKTYPFFWTRESEKAKDRLIEIFKEYLDY